jgi:hypothetical protein
MPAPIIGAGIAAAAGIGGAAISSRGQTRAAEAQERTASEALEFERERYREQMELARAAHEAREARMAPYRAAQADVLRRRYGVDVPAYQPAPFDPTAPPPQAGAPGMGAKPRSIAEFGGYGEPAVEEITPALQAPTPERSLAYFLGR